MFILMKLHMLRKRVHYMVKFLGITQTQYKVITDALTERTLNIQDELTNKNYSDELVLQKVATLRLNNQIHNEILEDWRNNESNNA